VLAVDVNLFGLSTSNCRVGWRVCDLTAFCRKFVTVDVNADGSTTDTLLGLRTFHILGEGVFSLWLVMSKVAVDVGLWAANFES
jgi:hypothetical protein